MSQNKTYKVLLKGCPGHPMVMGSQLAMFEIHFESPESILSPPRLQGQTGRPGPLEALGLKPASFAITLNSGGPF